MIWRLSLHFNTTTTTTTTTTTNNVIAKWTRIMDGTRQSQWTTHTQQHDKQRPRQQAASKTTRTTTKTTDNNNNPTWARGAQPPAKLRATSAKQHKNKQRPTTTAQNPTAARQYIQLLKGEKAAREVPKRTPRVSERQGEARERERDANYNIKHTYNDRESWEEDPDRPRHAQLLLPTRTTNN